MMGLSRLLMCDSWRYLPPRCFKTSNNDLLFKRVLLNASQYFCDKSTTTLGKIEKMEGTKEGTTTLRYTSEDYIINPGFPKSGNTGGARNEPPAVALSRMFRPKTSPSPRAKPLAGPYICRHLLVPFPNFLYQIRLKGLFFVQGFLSR